MTAWIERVDNINVVTIGLAAIVLVSVLRGGKRGAASSMRHLFFFVIESVVTLLSLFISFKVAAWLSPIVQRWLVQRQIELPGSQLSWLEQTYYTIVLSLRDLALWRVALLFVLVYVLVRLLFIWLMDFVLHRVPLFMQTNPHSVSGTRVKGVAGAGTGSGTGAGTGSAAYRQREGRFFTRAISRFIGAILGGMLGMVRALIVITVLLAYVTLQPHSAASEMIQASKPYRAGAEQVVEPLIGSYLTQRLPMFTHEAERELSALMQRKYEVIDNQIPSHIEGAAVQITKNARTDEQRAKLLYDWVGSRVSYDWDKVRQYESKRIWKEQTPQDTFATREGVCIDYARLYAVMARAVGLDVRVITGLGYDGKGGYGPHAWNEVWLGELGKWVPLDATWASTGNWFNPPRFADTHIPNKLLPEANLD
ncbi:transglutaminase-like domain-containing protein [Paenibacillus sp. 481]|uniref:transglutaminase-like domain-containing protein n=1 Tax=Paenibacillus sp. 481 TaxID=2835869 RepID=UPI001E55BF1A|nr:transglutaminase-like domain-containing protein [Paenibacillus sp. 481]UHA74635.1 transglutaminase domain-containing protein [Paenibacillus sp. 481]